jgi:glutamyl/glutaminyl-tRNA synthetase
VQYNGCKWRGQKLRVEVAKPDYLTRLQQERQEEEEKQQQQQDREAEHPQQQQSQQQDAEKDGEVGSEETHILRLPVPGSNHKVQHFTRGCILHQSPICLPGSSDRSCVG